MTRYKFNTSILKVERRERIVRSWLEADQVRYVREDMGWFITLEGSWEALYVGHEEPTLNPGQRVVVIIEEAS